MNNDQIDDLKQFITATVSQTEERLSESIDELNQKADSLEQSLILLREEVRSGFEGVGDAVEEIHQHNAQVELRLNSLEQQAA